uniref:Polymerase (RNA) III (DNA directed) polypeptide F n=1 Tax=Tetraodon nigroviridis TaxID=99883 RepID=H3C942_TETNG
RIKELCQQFPHGITDQVIQNDMPHLEPQQRAMAINKLLSLGQLDLLKNSSGLLYRMKDLQSTSKMKGSDNQEKLVYQIIEDAGNKGDTTKSSSCWFVGLFPTSLVFTSRV